MFSISYFAPAFNSASRFASIESSSRDPSKKRKRDASAFGSDSELRPPEAESSIRGSSPSTGYTSRATQSSAMLDEEAVDHDSVQFGALGQESLPGSSHRNFPHRFQGTPHSKLKGDIADELATLKPPLLFAKGPSVTTGIEISGNPGLRHRHLASVTAVLQRSLLEGDYIRAGRAWGILLRAEDSGHTMDLRTNDRWGIGAEILLRQKREVGNADRAASRWLSRERLEKVKAYYERLVLQYPYRKVAPNATGPLDFYIAMFGLWIYSVNEQHSVELADIGKAGEEVHRNGRKLDDGSESDSASASDMELQNSRDRDQIRKNALERVQEIAARLDELLASPPYIDNSRFWKLRGMVALWISDLSVVDLASESGSDLDHDDSSPTIGNSGEGYVNHDGSAKEERRCGQQRRKDALAEAEAAFRHSESSKTA